MFSGGRSLAQSRSAASAIRGAQLGVTSARAQLLLEVAEAYYDAALTERLQQIAEWTLTQADSTYCRIALVTQVGRGSEFDLVRAKASRDRQRPVVIQRTAEHDIALLRLRQLLHLPADAQLALSSDLDVGLAPAISPPTGAESRTAVREAAEWVAQREQSLRASRAARLPGLALTSTYERVAYPRQGAPSWQDTRTNWTVGARIDLPLFTGGQQRGSDGISRAELDAARARLRQAQELAELDTRTASARLAAAEASWQSTAAGTEEAARSYEIATLRHREGLSIQLELADARILLEQARVDQARAARDVLVERVRAGLLTDLPLNTTATSLTTSGAR